MSDYHTVASEAASVLGFSLFVVVDSTVVVVVVVVLVVETGFCVVVESLSALVFNILVACVGARALVFKTCPLARSGRPLVEDDVENDTLEL